jgi:hypothetical protein
MKKIVGILAVAAMIASTVFAADVSAATRIDANLFTYGADKSISLLKEGNASHVYSNPNITFSVSDDKAGAKILVTSDTDTDSTDVRLYNQTIWFRPFDAVKITLGNADVALNKESIDWTESAGSIGDGPDRAGYLVSVNVEGLSLDFGMQAWNDFWFEKADGADDATIGELFAKVAYSADFGSIGAIVEFNRMVPNGSGWYTKCRRSYGWWESLWNLTPKADGAIRDTMFGVGYRNNFGGVDTFLNVIGYNDDKFEWIRPEIFVGGSADAFGYKAFIAPVIFTNSDLDRKAECEVVVKLTYAMDGITPYAYFKNTNVLADKFVSTIKLGATGSVGAMGYDICAQIATGQGAAQDKVSFQIPVQFTMGF